MQQSIVQRRIRLVGHRRARALQQQRFLHVIFVLVPVLVVSVLPHVQEQRTRSPLRGVETDRVETLRRRNDIRTFDWTCVTQSMSYDVLDLASCVFFF